MSVQRAGLRWASALGLLACLAPKAAAGTSRGTSVATLRSSDLPIYARTSRGFEAALRRPTVAVSLAGMPPDSAAAALLALRPRVVVAIGLGAALLVHERLPETPLVYALVPEPRRHGLEGPNITGVTAEVAPGLELGVLRSLAPDVRRVGVVVEPADSAWAREASRAAARLDLDLVVAEVADPDQLAPRVRVLAARTDALWLAPDPELATPELFQLELAQSLAHRVPLLVFAPPLVDAGALVAAAPDSDWVGVRLAEITRRILAGVRAGDIPPTPIRRVHAMANLATARAIGRELPGAALGAAEVVR